MTEFISRNYGNEGYEIIIKTDSHEHYKAAESFARRLIDHSKPMTNAQKIRAMSDEEMCNWLFQRDCTNIAAFLEYCGMGVMNAVQLLEWLQQPAKGGKNNA